MNYPSNHMNIFLDYIQVNLLIHLPECFIVQKKSFPTTNGKCDKHIFMQSKLQMRDMTKFILSDSVNV